MQTSFITILALSWPGAGWMERGHGARRQSPVRPPGVAPLARPCQSAPATPFATRRPRQAWAKSSAPPLLFGRPMTLSARARPARTSDGPSTISSGSERSRHPSGRISPRRPPASCPLRPVGQRNPRPTIRPRASHSGKVQQPGSPSY